MQYRALGSSGLMVSQICFGSLTLGPLCAALPVAAGADLLKQAFALGLTFIDTAEQYRNYEHIRAALDAWPEAEQIVVATKTFAESDREAAWAVEDARIALKRNTLDIFLLHEVRDGEDFAARAQAWRTLLAAKQNGVIRAVGISTHSAAMAALAAEMPEVDIIHPLLNQADIGILDGGAEEMLAAITLAKQNGKGVYSMKALAGGALMHQARAALNWVFNLPQVDSVAIGFKDRAELITNIGWLHGERPPEARQVLLLDRNIAFDKEPRCHGCGRCVRRCAAGAMRLNDAGEAEWHKDKCLYCGYCIATCPWFCLSFC